MLAAIQNLDCISIMKPEVFSMILDAPTEVDRIELEDDCIARADELGVKAAFKRHLAAYKKDNLKANRFLLTVELEYTDKGAVKDCVKNYVSILRSDEAYKGKLKMNELSWTAEYHDNDKIEPWEDVNDAQLRCYIESKYGIYNEKKVKDALRIVFNENTYNPVKQIIESVKWDGKKRIESFLITWLGVYDDRQGYAREVSRLIFAGGINRLYDPGCKFDNMAVLIGRQGGGKSTIVRWLALQDEFFREVSTIDGKEGIEAIQGAWICEIGELLALTKTKEVEASKAYIARQVDTVRMAYDAHISHHKRQCIFIGTTNKAEFLTDKTGNRRYYPIECTVTGYDLYMYEDIIKKEILQCWAEAKFFYDLGQMPTVSPKELKPVIEQHQSMAVEDDYREGIILYYLEDKEFVCNIELWHSALGEIGKPSPKQSSDLTCIMQSIGGWHKHGKLLKTKFWGYQRCWVKEGFK